MADKKRNRTGSTDEPGSSLKMGVACLFAGAFAAYAITQDWLDGLDPRFNVLLWLVGGLMFGFGLARLFPQVFRRLFQGVGYLASFSAMMFVVLYGLGKELPTFSGAVNTHALSGHLSRTADDLSHLAIRSREGMEAAYAYVLEAVDQ